MTNNSPTEQQIKKKHLDNSAKVAFTFSGIISIIALVLMIIGIVTINNSPSIDNADYAVVEVTAVDTETNEATYVSVSEGTAGETFTAPANPSTQVDDRDAFWVLESGEYLSIDEWQEIQFWIGLGTGLAVILYCFAGVLLVGGVVLMGKAKKLN